MESGQTVTVETYDHQQINCTLVEIRGETAIVCSEREWRKSVKEKREPVEVLGWPLESVKAKRATPLASE
jgi:hypothetical protein